LNEIDKVMLMREKEIVQLFVELIIDQFHKNVYVLLFEIVIILLLNLNDHEVNDHQQVIEDFLTKLFLHVIVDQYLMVKFD
jgi:hypothetical protein